MALWPEPGPSTPPRLSRRSPIQYTSSWASDRKYALLVDAGSSGSRLQVYSWKDPDVTKRQRLRQGKKIKVLPKVEKGTQEGSGQEWQWKVEPGISSFGSHPQDIANYLRPLFRHALDVIPPHQVASTPVYIMATAGMRLIPLEQQRSIIRATCSFIEGETLFSLHGRCEDHVQVISGEEEGLLGWIAINYLMDGFHFKPDDDAKKLNADTKASKGKSTYGFLDMGGASTQIAFEPSKHALAASPASGHQQEEELAQVKLKLLDGTEVTHDVFVTTFLGFGANKARERYEQQLTHEASLAKSDRLSAVPDPCLPSGSLIHPATNASITGTGSFNKCLTSLAPLLEKEAPCSHPPCLFHGIHVPTIDFSVNHFIGVSEYWFSSHDIFNLGGVYDFVQFQKAAQKFCSRPWAELEKSLAGKKEFAPQVNEERLRMQCFKAAWMVTVLHDGIGIPRVIDHQGKGDGKDHVDQVGLKAGQKNLVTEEGDWFQSVNEVEGTSVSWTLGKAVLEATKDVKTVLTLDGPHREGSAIGLSGDRIASHAKEAAGNPLALLFLAIVLFLLGGFIFSRGKSPRAQRRRAVFNFFLPLPFGTCFGLAKKRTAKGDYILADTEDGEEEMEEGAVGLSDASSSSSRGEPASSPSRSSRHRLASGRNSTGPLMRFLPLTARRWLLRSATYIPGTAASRRASSRRNRKNRSQHDNIFQQHDVHMVEDLHLQSLYGREMASNGVRSAFSPSLMRASRPASPSIASLPPGIAASGPGGILSRPASRSSGRGSPRTVSNPSSSNGNANVGSAFSLRPYGSPPPLFMTSTNASRSNSPPQGALNGFPSSTSAGPSSQAPLRATSPAVGGSAGPGGAAAAGAPMAWTSSTSSSVSGSTTPVYSAVSGSGGGGSAGGVHPMLLPSISQAFAFEEGKDKEKRGKRG
ncbi:hypothetical protein BCV69DRAFT_257478 [Microstroma glucosiphilum]|uniref:Nucleoside phosphatase GDA1/CD39 n=1 Tax=Pseudomicrostroma glucosiphilum TaxID=1684307 RepID=A0A316UBI6_9BASI|nr:hypothetical protein BCV69DRAFT_257478 [Pseudomicrostroma glucosiphilum]PWN22556.1 hypothetical protein BCV69DRAFT_257478 [Pseudomicrostroma glucosiphilum]